MKEKDQSYLVVHPQPPWMLKMLQNGLGHHTLQMDTELTSQFHKFFCSLFSLHNETLNIWTHLLGAGYFFFNFVTIGQNLTYTGRPYLELLCMQAFLLSAQGCLLFSTTYHLFNCHSEFLCQRLLQLDLTGIAVLITGSFIPGIYLGFRCFPFLRGLYMCSTAMIFILGFLAANCFHKEEQKCIKDSIFSSLVVFGLVPAIHWFFITKSEVTVSKRRKLAARVLTQKLHPTEEKESCIYKTYIGKDKGAGGALWEPNKAFLPLP